MFSAFPAGETYKVLFWSFPWNAPDKSIEEILEERRIPVTPEKVMQLRAGLDRQYEALCRFIGGGCSRLSPGGEMLLGAGEMCRHDIIYGEAKRYGYYIEVAAEKEMVVDNIEGARLKVILYRLTR